MPKSKKIVLLYLGSARGKTLGGEMPPRVEPVVGGYFPL